VTGSCNCTTHFNISQLTDPIITIYTMEEVIQVNIYNGLDQDSSLSVLVIYSTGQAISPAVTIGLIR